MIPPSGECEEHNKPMVIHAMGIDLTYRMFIRWMNKSFFGQELCKAMLWATIARERTTATSFQMQRDNISSDEIPMIDSIRRYSLATGQPTWLLVCPLPSQTTNHENRFSQNLNHVLHLTSCHPAKEAT